MILPCDHYGHSVMKRSYYHGLSEHKKSFGHGILSPYTKFKIWRGAFWSLRPGTAAGYFVDLGLVPGPDGFLPSEAVARHLFAEGQRRHEQHLELHRYQLRSYLLWRRENGRGFKLLRQNRHLLEGTLYWETIKEFIYSD